MASAWKCDHCGKYEQDRGSWYIVVSGKGSDFFGIDPGTIRHADLCSLLCLESFAIAGAPKVRQS